MIWTVLFHDAFEAEFSELDVEVQDRLFAHTRILREQGPTLGRPTVDTLKGSKYPNMKELRFDANDGAWRVAFAFDPKRHAVLLVAGDKAGISEKQFYNSLIRDADSRYRTWLESLKGT